MDIRPSLGSAHRAFGVEATITPPTGPVITGALVFWLPPVMVEQPAGSNVKVVEQARVLVLGREECGAVARGTVVSVPEFDGAPVSDWRVDSVDTSHHDHLRVLVVPHGVET